MANAHHRTSVRSANNTPHVSMYDSAFEQRFGETSVHRLSWIQRLPFGLKRWANAFVASFFYLVAGVALGAAAGALIGSANGFFASALFSALNGAVAGAGIGVAVGLPLGVGAFSER